jgi:hypothetical protein
MRGGVAVVIRRRRMITYRTCGLQARDTAIARFSRIGQQIKIRSMLGDIAVTQTHMGTGAANRLASGALTLSGGRRVEGSSGRDGDRIGRIGLRQFEPATLAINFNVRFPLAGHLGDE